MENLLGLLRIRVVRGVNLAARDAIASDPYVVLKMGKQKLKTSVKKGCLNPEWNEDLTLSIGDPILPITLVRASLYHHNNFSSFSIINDRRKIAGHHDRYVMEKPTAKILLFTRTKLKT